MPKENKFMERSIPGMNRRERFVEAEHAQNAGATRRRLVGYFAREKALVAGMLAIVLAGTLCGVYAPSLQSRAIDIIAGDPTPPRFPVIVRLLLAGRRASSPTPRDGFPENGAGG
ncbi:MAG: hypothetical protein MR574_02445 [Oscillospiraceae bacterium]|nr:hypothetical protein [Oscillospiraceae bacterium]